MNKMLTNWPLRVDRGVLYFLSSIPSDSIGFSLFYNREVSGLTRHTKHLLLVRHLVWEWCNQEFQFTEWTTSAAQCHFLRCSFFQMIVAEQFKVACGSHNGTQSVGFDGKMDKSSRDIVLSLFKQPKCHPFQTRWLAVHTIWPKHSTKYNIWSLCSWYLVVNSIVWTSLLSSNTPTILYLLCRINVLSVIRERCLL